MQLTHKDKPTSGFQDSAGSTPDPDQELAELRRRVAELEALEVTRRQTEAALAQERNLLRTLIDNLPDYIYFKDTKSRFIIGNMAVAQLMGAITPDELVGKTDFDFYPQELAAQYYADEQAIITSRRPLVNREEPSMDQVTGSEMRLSTTKVPLYDGQGKIIGLVGMGRDITARKQVEAALAQRVAQLALINNIGRKIAGVLELDSLLDQAARLVQETFGYHHVALFLLDGDVARLRAIAGSYKSYFPPHHYQKLSQGIIGWVATHGEKLVANDVKAEARYISLIPDHTETQAELCLPIKVAGQIVGVLNIQSPRLNAFSENDFVAMEILTDQIAVAIENARLYQAVHQELTERRRAEAELRKYRDHLEEINAELNSFSYSVSHDLRAPLRAVQGFADALLEDYAGELDPMGQDYAQRIVAAAQRMDTLIQDLLAYSRLSRADLRLQPVELMSVVADALSQVEAELQERQAQLTIEEPLPGVMGHYATLVQVVANLLTNAVKFVAPEVRPQVRLWAEEQPATIRLWVEDNGIGIQADHQERIFHIFERLHGIETYPGTGIGLAVVRKGVTRMEGRVGVESTPDQGSKFWLELPKAADRG